MRVHGVILVLLLSACEPMSRIETPQTSTAPRCEPGSDAPDRLRFGVVDSGSYPVTGWRPFTAEIEKQLGIPIEVVVARQYDELLGMTVSGNVDFAVLPPFAYVLAHEREPCLDLLLTMVASGNVHYSGYLLVRKDSEITSVRDLVGRRIGFGDRKSASGFLFPLARLMETGFDLQKVLSQASMLEDHTAVLRALIAGEIDVGASYFGALKAARENGLDVSGLRVLAITGRIPLDAVVARKGLAASVKGDFTKAVLEINSTHSEKRATLSGLGFVNGFVRSDDSFYDPVRKVLATLRAAGLGGL